MLQIQVCWCVCRMGYTVVFVCIDLNELLCVDMALSHLYLKEMTDMFVSGTVSQSLVSSLA